MHVHMSAIHGLSVFLSVIVLGTVWRLLAMHLTGRTPEGTVTNKVGRAMAVQY